MNSFRIKKIRQSNLGAKLVECRKEKDLSLEDIYKNCNIPIKYLQALEEERWSDLPGEVYLKNFLEKYCGLLGLNFRLCFKQYKKQVDNKELHLKNKIKNKKSKQKISSLLEFITPKRFKIIIIIIVLIIFFGYIFFKINDYVSPPELDIIYPYENLETTENIITISGKTEAEAMVFINSENISVEEDGHFDFSVKLKYGLNRFYLTSQRKHGRKNEKEIIILKKQILSPQNGIPSVGEDSNDF
jgi:cytoskeletal protein RodZ